MNNNNPTHTVTIHSSLADYTDEQIVAAISVLSHLDPLSASFKLLAREAFNRNLAIVWA